MGPFGGVSVIAVGDFFQLKPAIDRWIFVQNEKDYGPLATNLLREFFKTHELIIIMRQKNDKDFAELLNRLREGQHTSGDIHVLKQNVREEDSKMTTIPHLYTTRKEVEIYNTSVFNKAKQENNVSIAAIDWVIGSSNPTIQTKVLQRIPDDSSKSMGLSSLQKCLCRHYK